jgi:hypothetical protein
MTRRENAKNKGTPRANPYGEAQETVFLVLAILSGLLAIFFLVFKICLGQ